MSNKNDENTVNIRMIYEDRENDGERVSPLLWNKIMDRVTYAPLGSGREYTMSTVDFLKRFKLLADEPTVGRNI